VSSVQFSDLRLGLLLPSILAASGRSPRALAWVRLRSSGSSSRRDHTWNHHFAETCGQFYPVVRPTGQQWVAYSSNESGQIEIYVESFPRGGARKVRISTDGGMQPRWRRNGKELYYISLDRKLMAVDATTGQTLEFSAPRAVSDTHVHERPSPECELAYRARAGQIANPDVCCAERYRRRSSSSPMETRAHRAWSPLLQRHQFA
jgi:hypothetical protein